MPQASTQFDQFLSLSLTLRRAKRLMLMIALTGLYFALDADAKSQDFRIVSLMFVTTGTLM